MRRRVDTPTKLISKQKLAPCLCHYNCEKKAVKIKHNSTGNGKEMGRFSFRCKTLIFFNVYVISKQVISLRSILYGFSWYIQWIVNNNHNIGRIQWTLAVQNSEGRYNKLVWWISQLFWHKIRTDSITAVHLYCTSTVLSIIDQLLPWYAQDPG